MRLACVRWGSCAVVLAVALLFMVRADWIEPYGWMLTGVMGAAAIVFWAAMLVGGSGEDDF